MERRDFQCFEQLATTLHYGRAARDLGMSPSALTRRIQAMEEELGQPLLLRDQRRVQLTAAGNRFLHFARAQIEQWEQLLGELRDEAEAPTGQLNIACTVTACHTVLPRILAVFRERYPGITPRLITQDAARSLAQLESGEVDLAVIPTDAGHHRHLEQIALGQTDLTFIAPPSNGSLAPALSSSPPDWQQLPFVAQVSGLERERLLHWLKSHGVEPRIVAEVRGNEGIIAMVSLGTGVALVPELVLESSPLRHTVSRLSGFEPPPGYQVSLCALPRSLKRRVVQLFWTLAAQS